MFVLLTLCQYHARRGLRSPPSHWHHIFRPFRHLARLPPFSAGHPRKRKAIVLTTQLPWHPRSSAELVHSGSVR